MLVLKYGVFLCQRFWRQDSTAKTNVYRICRTYLH